MTAIFGSGKRPVQSEVTAEHKINNKGESLKDITPWIFRGKARPEVILETHKSALAYAEKYYPWKYEDIKDRILDPKMITAHGFELHPNEIWVILEEAPRYAVTNTGRCVLSMTKKTWKEMKGTPASKGHGKPHLVVGISFTPGNSKQRYIHQLVEENFCRRFFDVEMYRKTALWKSEQRRAKKIAAGKHVSAKLIVRNSFDVHHLDGNPQNNAAENLILLPRAIHKKLENVVKYEVLLKNQYIECLNILELTRVIGLEVDICSVAGPIADAYKTIRKEPCNVTTAIATIAYCRTHLWQEEETKTWHSTPMDMSMTDTPDEPFPGNVYKIRVTFRRDNEKMKAAS